MAEQKTCRQCNAQFTVEDEDLAFYKKISPTFAGKTFEIPSPTLCPHCRWQRRIAWRNEYALYKRKCDKTGVELVSRYRAGSSFPVYYVKDWQSDGWDAKEYGQSYDPERPFFEQLDELIKKVPRQNLSNDYMNDINSEYTNCSGGSKNCYMIFESDRSEDCYYSRGMTDTKDCVDCIRTNESQLCYEGIDINKCYNCFYLQDSDNCNECYFSSNLSGCKYCFGCDGLNQKEYYLYNENVGKAKWEEFMSGVKFTNGKVKEYFSKLEEIRRQTPKKFAKVSKCENSDGDHLINCKNSHFCFDSQKLEDCAYCFEVPNEAKDSYDYSSFGLATNMIYECTTSGCNAYNILFSNETWINVSNCFYCDNTQSSKNCFGCIGLNKKQYCILNKQYTKEEYEQTVGRIIEKMIADGEWGEFFPMSISPFGYNESLSIAYHPKSKEEMTKFGAKWQENDYSLKFDGPFYEPEDDIDEYRQNEGKRSALLSGILKCASTGKAFKIMPQELAFYISHNVPVPVKYPEERYLEIFSKRNPRVLYHRQCMNEGCQNEFETTYAPDRPEKVYCESCYQKNVL